VPTDWREAFDLGDAPAPQGEAPEEESAGVVGRLREGLSRSRRALTAELSASFTGRIDDATWEKLEEALILADVGAMTTADVVRRLEDEAGTEAAEAAEAA
jgi:fused signal recognition particle receptor